MDSKSEDKCVKGSKLTFSMLTLIPNFQPEEGGGADTGRQMGAPLHCSSEAIRSCYVCTKRLPDDSFIGECPCNDSSKRLATSDYSR